MTYSDIESKSFGPGEEGGDGSPSGMARAWHVHMGGLKATYHRLLSLPGAQRDPRIDALIDPVQSNHQKNATNWAIPNEIEILLVRLMPEREVLAEAESAFATAERIAVPSAPNLRKSFDAATPPDDRQAILATLLRDTHNRYAARRSERVGRRLVANRMTFLGFGLTAVIIGVFLALGTGWFNLPGGGQGDLPANPNLMAELTDLVKYNLIVTTFFGFLGAYLSRLIAFQNTATALSFDDLENSYSWHFLMVRLLVGGLSSVIVYFVISGNLIGGELFPSAGDGASGGFGSLWTTYAGDDPSTSYAGPSANFAKLIVWCFISGFSERFLPDHLGAIESQSKGAG